MRAGVGILWTCVFAVTMCLLWFSSFDEAFDQCYDPKLCSKFVGELYTGYNNSFVESVVNSRENGTTSSSTKLSTIGSFCQTYNGGYANINGMPNYTLDTTNHTFLCKDPRHPDATMSELEDKLEVTSSYDNTTYDKEGYLIRGGKPLLTEISDYCKGKNGGVEVMKDVKGNNIDNYTVNDENKILCKSQFDPAIMMPKVNTSNAVWEPNPKVNIAQNLDQVKKNCIVMNGNRSTLTDATGAALPLYTISTNGDKIVYNCTSYWTKNPITKLEGKEKVVYKDNKTYGGGVPNQFTKLEEVNTFCKPYNESAANYKIIDTDDKYTFECLSALDGKPVNSAEVGQKGFATYVDDVNIKFKTPTDVTTYCDNGKFKILREEKGNDIFKVECDPPKTTPKQGVLGGNTTDKPEAT